jgi:hypothetical protein
MRRNKTIKNPSLGVLGSFVRRIFMDELRDYLNHLEPGSVEETNNLERLLAEVWDDLGGDNCGMAEQKLNGRMEHVDLQPPVLSFSIERHGGIVNGSTRAELQRWKVDRDLQTATCELIGHRQLSPLARRLDSDISPRRSQAGSWSAKQMTGLAGSEVGESLTE